jgi:hypothetical protein
MASRFLKSCSPVDDRFWLRRPSCVRILSQALWISLLTIPALGQMLLKPSEPGEQVTLMPSDVATLEANEARKDLPCTVTARKAELGFDLRFHSGFDVTIPLAEIAGDGGLLTVVFRVSSQDDHSHAANFVQHFQVPSVAEEAKGEALLQGVIDIGEGAYHVDWLMRDRAERICSSSWDVDANLAPKDKPIPLFLPPHQIAQAESQPFVNDAGLTEGHTSASDLNVKLLVNFAPQDANSAALQRSDTEALVSILKTIERDPRVGRVSLVAFNMEESRVVYRQETAEQIDFPALGKALQTMKLGTINVQRLAQKHSETDFLENLIATEVGASSHPDAVIFAGPKAMLSADVPQEDLRRIGNIECPVFYMNYNLNPQAVPWKDSISHAIRTFKGTEYTISRPRDLWFSTSEMVNRIVRRKHEKALTTVSAGSTR